MVEATETAESSTEEQQDQATQAQSVEFSEATDTNVAGPSASLGILLDMEVSVTVAVGQTKVSIQQLLQFGPGSVLKLDKAVDAPADLYLKETKFATGNIVVVDDRFAVRIKEILGAGTKINPANN